MGLTCSSSLEETVHLGPQIREKRKHCDVHRCRYMESGIHDMERSVAAHLNRGRLLDKDLQVKKGTEGQLKNPLKVQ